MVMDRDLIQAEIDRCELEAESAKKNGNYEIAFLKLDAARRLREKLENNPTLRTKTAGGQST
jgi:hypothetical protein